jgi:hypothetical protein
MMQNGKATCQQIGTDLTRECSLEVLVGALLRARPDHPKPHLITALIGQCQNYERNPVLGPAILRTIERIEGKRA